MTAAEESSTQGRQDVQEQRVLFSGKARASHEKNKLKIFAADMPVLLEVLQGGPHAKNYR